MGMTLAVSAVSHNLAIDASPVSAGSFWCARRSAPGRLLVNFQRLEDVHHPLDRTEPGFEAFAAIRRRISVVPGARDQVGRMVAGIVRRGLEDQAIGLRTDGMARGSEHPLHEVVDHRLASSLDAIARDESADTPIVIESQWGPTRGSGGSRPTNWRRRLLAASIGGGVLAVVIGWLLKTEYAVVAGLALTATMPLISGRIGARTGLRLDGRPRNHTNSDRPGPDPHGSEAIRVGRGWIETGSGRRRHRTDMVTTVAPERDDSDRIEVRIVSPARVVRLRFESLNDENFRAFWARWAA